MARKSACVTCDGTSGLGCDRHGYLILWPGEELHATPSKNATVNIAGYRVPHTPQSLALGGLPRYTPPAQTSDILISLVWSNQSDRADEVRPTVQRGGEVAFGLCGVSLAPLYWYHHVPGSPPRSRATSACMKARRLLRS